MAAAANLEHKQTANKGYRKTKKISQKIASISVNVGPQMCLQYR